MDQLQFNLQPERRVYTVSDLTARIRDLLARNFTDVLVQGEISNLRPASSGHIYFTLKDERAQVRCVFFKQQQRGMKFRPEDGLKVTVRGSVSVYEARGEYQIYVESLEPVGRGALQAAFEQLKKKLEAEGLFDPARKKLLPLLPSRIGLITSSTGAAVRAGSVRPHSSRRCWLAGMAPPQRLQCLACEVTWLWQCGHSIDIWRPHTLSFVKDTLGRTRFRITEGQRSNGHCPVGLELAEGS